MSVILPELLINSTPNKDTALWRYLFFFSNITLVYSNNYKGSFYRLSIFAKFFQVWIPSQEQLYNVHQH